MSIKDYIHLTKNFIGNGSKGILLVRSCENIGSLSGSLTGWLNAKLSEYGRKQAKYLSTEFFVDFENTNFMNVYTSDLLRSQETAEICLGFDPFVRYRNYPELREIYFGKNEGLFYDGLNKEEKSMFNKTNYKFPKGESWLDVKYRCVKFINELEYNYAKPGNNNSNNNSKLNLVFTHGAFITSMLYNKNVKTMPPPGSVLLVELNLDDQIKANEQIDSYYNEFSKLYNCLDEQYNQSLFDTYNPIFEEFLNKKIKSVQYIYLLPDLSDHLL